MKLISALVLWFLCLGTGATAYAQVTGQAADITSEGNIVLTWTAPLLRENGTLLSPSELVGYQIYYTIEETGESTMIEIDDINADHYELKNLAPGTYYFAVTAVDSTGLVSQLSDMIQAVVR